MGPVVCSGWKSIAYRSLVGKPKKRHFGRPSCRWEYSNNMDLREIGWGGMAWIRLA